MKNRLTAIITAICLAVGICSFQKDHVSASYGRINVITTFGTTETAQYGVPTAFNERFERIKNKVSSYYRIAYGIEINFTKPTTSYVLYPPVDVCRTNAGEFNALCDCVLTKSCQMGDPYHCTNIEYNMGQMYSSSLNYNGYRMHITASMLCTNTSSVEGSTPVHGTANGLFYGIGAYSHLMVRDYDYVKDNSVTNWTGNSTNITWVAKTVAHEIGHIYGVVDHYDPNMTLEEGMEDDCIWGKKRNDEDVARTLATCSYCYNTIMSNRSKYQHT